MKTRMAILVAILIFSAGCEIMPRNTLKDCRVQCADSRKPEACYDFCDCIHSACQSLDTCLARYERFNTATP